MAIISKKAIRPGQRVRVLVVDDSVVIRRLVVHALEQDPLLEIAGVASNGSQALERIAQLQPDVLTLDIEMPEMGGLDVLRRLRDVTARPRVVLFSTLTERGAAVTLEALSLGADDYVAKASNAGSLDRSLLSLRAELIPKLKQFFLFESQAAPAPVLTKYAPVSLPRNGARPSVLAIGVSTGGPAALHAVIPQLPRDLSVPVLIVQHMPPLFTRLLAERLQASTALKVSEGKDGDRVEAGRVYIAPGDYHMIVRKSAAGPVIRLNQEPPENSCRPAVDVLFRSVAETYRGNAIGAVLTGMGQDGKRGAETLREAGAYIIAQDEPSSVVWGMPGAVVNAGLADSVVPLEGVVPHVLQRLGGR